MASIFSSLKEYAGKWAVKSVSPFTAEEQKSVSSAEVVNSDYGLSVCFHMVSGGMMYLPVDRDSSKFTAAGEVVDMAKAKVITLSKQGEKDILRVKL